MPLQQACINYAVALLPTMAELLEVFTCIPELLGGCCNVAGDVGSGCCSALCNAAGDGCGCCGSAVESVCKSSKIIDCNCCGRCNTIELGCCDTIGRGCSSAGECVSDACSWSANACCRSSEACMTCCEKGCRCASSRDTIMCCDCMTDAAFDVLYISSYSQHSDCSCCRYRCRCCGYSSRHQNRPKWQTSCSSVCAEADGSDEYGPGCDCGPFIEVMVLPWFMMAILSHNITVSQERQQFGDSHVQTNIGVDPALLCCSILTTPFFGIGIYFPSLYLRYKLMSRYNYPRRNWAGDECIGIFFFPCSILQVSRELARHKDHLGTCTVQRRWAGLGNIPAPQRIGVATTTPNTNDSRLQDRLVDDYAVQAHSPPQRPPVVQYQGAAVVTGVVVDDGATFAPQHQQQQQQQQPPVSPRRSGGSTRLAAPPMRPATAALLGGTASDIGNNNTDLAFDDSLEVSPPRSSNNTRIATDDMDAL